MSLSKLYIIVHCIYPCFITASLVFEGIEADVPFLEFSINVYVLFLFVNLILGFSRFVRFFIILSYNTRNFLISQGTFKLLDEDCSMEIFY